MRPDVSWLLRWGVYTPTGRYHQLPPWIPLSPYVHAVCQKAWGGSKWDETEILLVDSMCSREGNSEVRKREDEGLRDGRGERGKRDKGWKRDVKYSRIKKDKEEEEEGRCDRVPTDRLLLSERSQCAYYSPPDMSFRVLIEEKRWAETRARFYNQTFLWRLGFSTVYFLSVDVEEDPFSLVKVLLGSVCGGGIRGTCFESPYAPLHVQLKVKSPQWRLTCLTCFVLIFHFIFCVLLGQ